MHGGEYTEGSVSGLSGVAGWFALAGANRAAELASGELPLGFRSIPTPSTQHAQEI